MAAPDVHGDRQLLELGSLIVAGSAGAWTGSLDLTGNDLIVHNGNPTAITSLVANGYNSGSWSGRGVTSSAAAADSSHLTALGVELNNDGGQPIFGNGTALGLFDGKSPALTDVLVKYTYYGDANLDGKVDGSDYTRVDFGFLNHLTGWSNGDFDYDQVIDGSDYTLVDNAFNTQGVSLAAQIASAPSSNISARHGRNSTFRAVIQQKSDCRIPAVSIATRGQFLHQANLKMEKGLSRLPRVDHSTRRWNQSAGPPTCRCPIGHKRGLRLPLPMTSLVTI